MPFRLCHRFTSGKMLGAVRVVRVCVWCGFSTRACVAHTTFSGPSVCLGAVENSLVVNTQAFRLEVSRPELKGYAGPVGANVRRM